MITNSISLSLAAALLFTASLCPVAIAGGTEHHHAAHASSAAPADQPFGRPGNPKKAARTIVVEMDDAMRFSPARIQVKQGETLRFVVKNRGAVNHEMVLGTQDSLAVHAAMMRQHPGTAHDETSVAHVAPGKETSLVWQFTRAGSFPFGCLVPGHFEAGMHGDIDVRSK